MVLGLSVLLMPLQITLEYLGTLVLTGMAFSLQDSHVLLNKPERQREWVRGWSDGWVSSIASGQKVTISV